MDSKSKRSKSKRKCYLHKVVQHYNSHKSRQTSSKYNKYTYDNLIKPNMSRQGWHSQLLIKCHQKFLFLKLLCCSLKREIELKLFSGFGKVDFRFSSLTWGIISQPSKAQFEDHLFDWSEDDQDDENTDLIEASAMKEIGRCAKLNKVHQDGATTFSQRSP